MVRFLFSLLLLIHGFIHLPGFLSQWHLATFNQLSGKSVLPVSETTSKLLGLCWLLVALGFMLASVGYWFRREWWVVVTMVSTIGSQALIILYWPDAKAGTIANVLITVAVVLIYAHIRFDRQSDEEVRRLLNQSTTHDKTIITPDKLTGLPIPVQRWLMRSGVVGKEQVHTVRLRQYGLMRTTPTSKWMQAEAEQYFTVDKPGFVWKATITMAPFLHLTGQDRYEDGHGSMNIRFMSLVDVADAKGAETDQGTLLRFLSEIIWFPSAALSPYIHWEAVDQRSASATMRYGDVTASGLFRFNEDGDVAGFETQRYMEANGHYTLETWTTAGNTYRTLCNGIRIPTHGEATWKLKTGDFTWYKLIIGAVDYNKPVLY